MVKLLATNRTKTWWNPSDFQGVEMCWRRGKFLPTTKKRKLSLALFLPWKESTSRCNNFKDPGVQVVRGEDVFSTTRAWLAQFGSWCLFGVMKMTGRRFLPQFFASEKKNIWTWVTWVSFFSGRLFLGFLVGFGKGFTLEMLFQDAFFPYRFLLTPFAGERDRRDGPKPASLLIFEILVWEEDFTRKLGKEMYIPVKSTKNIYIYDIYR